MNDPIEKEKLVKTFDIILDNFKKLETELLVHRTVIEALKPIFSDLDESLERARKNPILLGTIDKKYEEMRQSCLQRLDLMESVSEFVASWKPTGPIN
jgi:hypothetical protein